MNSFCDALAVRTDRPSTMGVLKVGVAVGLPGLTVGRGVVGSGVGSFVGSSDGRDVGTAVGAALGASEGSSVGIPVG